MTRFINMLVRLFHIRKEQKTTEQIFQELDDITNSFLYMNEVNIQKFSKNFQNNGWQTANSLIWYKQNKRKTDFSKKWLERQHTYRIGGKLKQEKSFQKNKKISWQTVGTWYNKIRKTNRKSFSDNHKILKQEVTKKFKKTSWQTVTKVV